MSTQSRPTPLLLLARTCRVAALVGFHLAAAGALTAASWARGGRAAAGPVWRARVTTAVGALGAAFTKVGQLLATRRDLLPPHWCAALGALHDDVPPPSWRSTSRVLRAAFRGREWPFAEVEAVPVAAGSIAVVHRAVLHDGRVVAVKVRRASAVRALAADLALLRLGSAAVARLPVFRGIPVTEVVGQVCAAVSGQLDLDAERAALTGLRANLADLPYVLLPAAVDEACGPGVLVMDFVADLSRFSGEHLDAERRREVVEQTLTAVYTMLFRDGVVHCDLHPGNLYLGRDGRIVVLDAGFTVRLDDAVRELFAAFFFNMAAGRGERCADLVLRSAVAVPAGADVEGFRAALAGLVGSVSGLPAGEFDLASFAARLFDLQRRYGVCAAPEFVFPLLSLLVIEGMVDELGSDVDFQAVAAPILLAELSASSLIAD